MVKNVHDGIDNIFFNLIHGAGHGLRDAFFCLDDFVDVLVDCLFTEKVVARHIVFLPDTVGAILALLTVGICPRELYERHAGRCGESQADPGSFDIANCQFADGVVLEQIDGALFIFGRHPAADYNCIRVQFFESIAQFDQVHK